MTTDLPEPTSERPQPGPAHLHRAAPRQAAAPPRRPHPGRAQGGRRGAGAQGLPRQAAVHALLRAAGRVARGDDRPAQGDPRRARRRPAARPCSRPLVAAHRRRRHDDQVRVAAARRRHRRVGADALPQARHDLHLQPGRLRHELPVLRDRPGRAHPQHVAPPRSSSRSCTAPGCCAAASSPRPSAAATRREAGLGDEDGRGTDEAGAPTGPTRSPTSSSWAWARRWPTTRPRSARSAGSPTRRRTAWACRRAASRCRRSAWCPAIDKLAAEGIPVTLALSLHAPGRRAAQRAGADQHPLEGRRGARRRAPLLRGRPVAG